MAPKSNNFMESLRFRENKDDKEVSFALLLPSVAIMIQRHQAQRQELRTTRQRTQVHNKYRTCPIFELTPEEFVKNICHPRRQRSLTATRLQREAARCLLLIVAATS